MEPYTIALMAGFQIYAGWQQSEMTLATSRFQAEIDERNAQYIEVDAWNAEKDGFTQSARYKSTVNAIIGKQKVAFASQGVDVSSGTAKAIQDESRLIGRLNVLDIQKAARQKAYGLKIQASSVRLGSQFSQLQAGAEASAQQLSGILGAAGTGVSNYDRF